MVGIAQLVSAPDCGSGGQGFESLYPPSNLMGYRQAVRHSTLTAALVGSNPTSPARAVDENCSKNKYGALAQSVEHLTFNQVVRGSNPRCFTSKEHLMLEMFFFCKKIPTVIQTAGLRNIVLQYLAILSQRVCLYRASLLILLQQQHLFRC